MDRTFGIIPGVRVTASGREVAGMAEVEDRADTPGGEGTAGAVAAWLPTGPPADLPSAELVRKFHVHHPALDDLRDRHRVFGRLRDECPVGRSAVFGGYWV